MSVFVDTSAWYAAADVDDAGHVRAARRLEEFAGALVTSDHVIVETWFLATRRLGIAVAERLVNGIRMGIARIEPAIVADLEAAASIGEAFADQRFSLVDRTSWAIMQRLGIREALALDADFSIYRFGLGRRQAFVVHS
ncbi:type II toxin-antitoxin system VapC family toxin [Candidatus Poriferisodalis sp.]|uniref:type II toxin-antitoxin system VapC family toxin n=1 Tax=Candidatus Poriferisodalis sp. TaxID=3101277 RepID=UPI003B5CB997